MTAEILGLPRRLLSLTWRLLVALNTVHSFPDVALYRRRAAKAHRLVRFRDDTYLGPRLFWSLGNAGLHTAQLPEGGGD